MPDSSHTHAAGSGEIFLCGGSCTSSSAYLEGRVSASHATALSFRCCIAPTCVTIAWQHVDTNSGSSWHGSGTRSPDGISTSAASVDSSYCGPSTLKPPSTPSAILVGAASGASLLGRSVRRFCRCTYSVSPLLIDAACTCCAPKPR